MSVSLSSYEDVVTASGFVYKSRGSGRLVLGCPVLRRDGPGWRPEQRAVLSLRGAPCSYLEQEGKGNFFILAIKKDGSFLADFGGKVSVRGALKGIGIILGLAKVRPSGLPAAASAQL